MSLSLDQSQKGEVIVHAYTKAGKRYTALSNAYRRECTKGSTVGVPVCSDYGKMFDPCDKFNKQVHGRIWPHRHGGKGRLGERGKFSSFAFGTVLQNTFNAFRDISGVGSDEYEYYYYCEELARQVYEYADTLSNDIVA